MPHFLYCLMFLSKQGDQACFFFDLSRGLENNLVLLYEGRSVDTFSNLGKSYQYLYNPRIHASVSEETPIAHSFTRRQFRIGNHHNYASIEEAIHFEFRFQGLAYGANNILHFR